MKYKKESIIYIIISLFLIIGIVMTLKTLKGSSSNQVKETVKFLNKLEDIKAIDENSSPNSKDIKEVKNSTNGNSRVKYSLIAGRYAVDLDENFKVVGFLDQDTAIEEKESITKEKALGYARKYLAKIIDDEIKFKEVKNIEMKDTPFYIITFYKYYENFLVYNSEILMKIDKYSGNLVGYSGFVDNNIKYSSEVNVDLNSAKNIAIGYLEKLQINANIIEEPELYYVNIDDINKLCYIFKINEDIEGTEANEHEIIINASNGEIIKLSTNAINLIPLENKKDE